MSASELLKTVRKELGLSQAELANVIFVTVTTISRWENGKSLPTRIARETLADYCEKNDIEKDLISAIRKIR